MADLTLHDMDWQDFRDWDNERIMETYISSPEIDKQNDLIPTEAIKSAMDFYMKYGIYSYKHDEIPIGRPLSYCVKDGKVKLKVGIYDKLPMHNKVWKEIQEHGKKGTSSIRGEALDKKVVCDEGTCHNLINELGLWSVSWVGDNPANKDAVVSFVSMAKADDGDDPLIKQLKNVHNMLVQKYNGIARGKVGISGKFTLDDEVAAIREEEEEEEPEVEEEVEEEVVEDEQMEEAAEEGLVPEEAGVQEATPAEEAETVTQEAEEMTYASMSVPDEDEEPKPWAEQQDNAYARDYHYYQEVYSQWKQEQEDWYSRDIQYYGTKVPIWTNRRTGETLRPGHTPNFTTEPMPPNFEDYLTREDITRESAEFIAEAEGVNTDAWNDNDWQDYITELKNELPETPQPEPDPEPDTRSESQIAEDELREQQEAEAAMPDDAEAKKLLDEAQENWKKQGGEEKGVQITDEDLINQLGITQEQVDAWKDGTLGVEDTKTDELVPDMPEYDRTNYYANEQEWVNALMAGEDKLEPGEFYDYNVGVIIGNDGNVYDWRGTQLDMQTIWPSFYDGLTYTYDGTGLFMDESLGLYFDATSDIYYDYYGDAWSGQEVRDYYMSGGSRYTQDLGQMRMSGARDVYGTGYTQPMPGMTGGGGGYAEEEPVEEAPVEEEATEEYTIEEIDGLFCVMDAKGKKVKCYKTKKGAENRIKKLLGE